MRLSFLLTLVSIYAAVQASSLPTRAELRRHDDQHDANSMPITHTDGQFHSRYTGSPLTVLNETEILLGHDPDPLSYWAHDFESPELPSYQGLMVAHVVGMSLAFFGLLPAGEQLRPMLREDLLTSLSHLQQFHSA